ncbi:hypothetical protein EDB84DRAFT_1583248 [Lactarius hengduanensis]|nr:hypothetical protein EDB84DRAFT_1583248 [Lactarius hengduanensis]
MADLLESMSVHEIDSSIAIVSKFSPYYLFLILFAFPTFFSWPQGNSCDTRNQIKRKTSTSRFFHLIELILLAPHLWLECKSLIFPAVLILANALLARSIVSNQPEDAIFATKSLRHLRDQPHATLGFPRHAVTTLLLSALAFLVMLEDSNVVQNIEEMTVLFHELLTEDASEGDVTLSSTLLAGIYFSHSHLWTLDQPLTQVIECLQLAKMRKPELRVVHIYLARCLCIRYVMTHVNDDYEGAASIMDELIASSSPGDIQDERVAIIQEFVAAMAMLRSVIHRTPEYSEAMYRASVIISSDPIGHHFRPWLNSYWESIAEDRFDYFGLVEGHEARPSMFQPEPVVYIGDSVHRAEAIQMVENTKLLKGLLSGIRNNDITNIDEALELGRTLFTSSSIPMHPLASSLFEAFGGLLFEAFQRTKKIEYLNESISTRRQLIGRLSPQSVRVKLTWGLSATLLTRFQVLESLPSHRTQDLDEALELLSQRANDRDENFTDRLRFACYWASLSRLTRHHSVSTAYETAVSLMQYTPLFAPTLQLQHATLANTNTDHHRLPMPRIKSTCVNSRRRL